MQPQSSQPHPSDAGPAAIPVVQEISPPSIPRTPGRDSRPATPLARAIPLVVFSSLAVLPYLLVRRLTALRRTLADLGAENAHLRRDVSALMSETAVRRHEQQQLARVLAETKGGVEWLRRHAQHLDAAHAARTGVFERDLQGIRRELERLEMDTLQKDRVRTQAEEACRSELQVLLRETQWTREHLAALRGLGTSLADVAAFMHESEVQWGYTPRTDDGRGIEKIRQLALKMQSLPPWPHDAKPQQTPESKSESASEAA